MVSKLVYFMALLFPIGAITGCRSEEATPNPDTWIVAMKERLQEHRRISLERMKILPKNLAYFSGKDPVRWQEGADRLRALEENEKGFLYDRIRELLAAGVRRGAAGSDAREELVRMGEIIALTALYENRDRAKWISATAALKAKGRQGMGAAAVKLIQKFISENAQDIAVAREGLVLLGPASIRFLVEALRSERVRQTARHVGLPAALVDPHQVRPGRGHVERVQPEHHLAQRHAIVTAGVRRLDVLILNDVVSHVQPLLMRQSGLLS